MAKLLIVDDSPLIRSTLRAMVESMGHEVAAEAGNGTAATEYFRNLRPDAVLLDLLLPDKSGLELIDNFRKLDPSCRILVITAVGQVQVDKHAIKSGCQAVLHKPFSFDELKHNLDKVLGC